MNWNVCVGVVLALLIYPTYRALDEITSSDIGGIVFLNEKTTTGKNEVTIDDAIKGEGFSIRGDGTRGDLFFKQKTAYEIKTTYDAFGNKTEIRLFLNHPRLKQIMLRTLADGQRQVYLY